MTRDLVLEPLLLVQPHFSMFKLARTGKNTEALKNLSKQLLDETAKRLEGTLRKAIGEKLRIVETFSFSPEMLARFPVLSNSRDVVKTINSSLTFDWDGKSLNLTLDPKVLAGGGVSQELVDVLEFGDTDCSALAIFRSVGLGLSSDIRKFV